MDQNTEKLHTEVGALFLSQQRGYGFAFMDPAGVITSWTAAAQWITGWSEEEAVGQSIALIIAPED